MQQTYKLRYRIFSQDFQGSWGYHENYQKYFDTYEDAIDYATSLSLKGIVEEWVTDELNDYVGEIDIVDIMCDNFYKFNFENDKGIAELNWNYKKDDRLILTPGYVFNYFRHYVDKATILSDILEVIEDKSDQTWVV